VVELVVTIRKPVGKMEVPAAVVERDLVAPVVVPEFILVHHGIVDHDKASMVEMDLVIVSLIMEVAVVAPAVQVVVVLMLTEVSAFSLR
jgi:hypothetical protein